jgi:hypothetical protein
VSSLQSWRRKPPDPKSGGADPQESRSKSPRIGASYPDGQLVDLRGQSESPRSPIDVLIEFLVDGFGDDPQHLPLDLDRLQNLFNDRLTNLLIITNLNRVTLSCTVEVWGLSTLVFGLNILPCNQYAKVIPHRSTEVLF